MAWNLLRKPRQPRSVNGIDSESEEAQIAGMARAYPVKTVVPTEKVEFSAGTKICGIPTELHRFVWSIVGSDNAGIGWKFLSGLRLRERGMIDGFGPVAHLWKKSLAGAMTLQILDYYQDMTKFWDLVLNYEKPGWPTENRVEVYNKAFRLRRFSHRGRSGTPILVLGPQAGHTTSIVDYAVPGQSLVELCRDHTDRPIYAVEWRSATPDRRHETIDDLIKQTDACVDHIGGKAHLLGLCQAGWQSAIYAALHPEKVASLVLGGSPIDFAAGGGKIRKTVNTLPLSFYFMMVMMGHGIMRGQWILAGFKNMNAFDRYINDYINLFLNIEDPGTVERSRRFRRWYEFTQGLPGGWYLQAVKQLFKENRLIRGKLKILGRRVDLSAVKCPVVLIAGEKDDITPPPQLLNMADHVSGEVREMTIPKCGHIGLFIKKEALREYWRPAIDFVLGREHPPQA